MTRFLSAVAATALMLSSAHSSHPKGYLYLSGVFCNTDFHVQQVFENEKNGMSVPMSLFTINKEKVHCGNQRAAELIFSKVNLIREDVDGNKPVYFYKGSAVGMRFRESIERDFDSPVTQYFFTYEPMNPQDVGFRI